MPKKRTKFIWDANETNWDKLAMPMLYHALRKQKWFTGKILFDWNNIPYKLAKKNFEFNRRANRKVIPDRMVITQKYETYEMEVWVEWNFKAHNRDRYDIILHQPYVEDRPVRGSLFVEGAVKRIHQAFDAGVLKARDAVQQKLQGAEQKVKMKKLRDKLGEIIGVSIEQGYSSGTFQYGKERAFGLVFSKVENTGLFYIDDIRGKFTTKDIKRFIKIIGGNPRAVAARLAHKKSNE